MLKACRGYSGTKLRIPYFIDISQIFHKKISTHRLTVLTISVILHIEQREREKKIGRDLQKILETCVPY